MSRRRIHRGGQFLQVWECAHAAHVRFGRLKQAVIKKERDDLSGRDMKFLVVGTGEGDQVLGPVVACDAVDVMHGDVLRQSDTAGGFVYVPMLKHVAVSVTACVFGFVQKDVSASHGTTATLPRMIGRAEFRAQQLCVVPNKPPTRETAVFTALRPGELCDFGWLSAPAFTYTSRHLPIGWWLQSLPEFHQSQVAHAKRRVVAQIVSLDKAWRPSSMSGAPRDLFVAAALAAIDRRIGRTLSLASIGVRELRFHARVARGMAHQISRGFVAMVGPTRNWLVTAALAEVGNGTHSSMIRLDDAIGG